MARNRACSVYIGNLDEKVSERVLYEILIQVGRVVDLHIPRDKETNRHKGYAFAEYETEEIADYAVKLFSGLVRLHSRTLKFAMSAQDKSSQNESTPVTPKLNSLQIPKPYSVLPHGTEVSQGLTQSVVNTRAAAGTLSAAPAYPPAPDDGLASRGLGTSSFEYNRRFFGAMLNNVSRPGAKHPIAYPSY